MRPGRQLLRRSRMSLRVFSRLRSGSRMGAARYRVHVAEPAAPGRPLCCARTFLSAGLVEEAKTEARRVLEALAPWIERGVPVVGLEPSCLLSFRDEFTVMLPGAEALARNPFLFEEFLARGAEAGRLDPPLEH